MKLSEWEKAVRDVAPSLKGVDRKRLARGIRAVAERFIPKVSEEWGYAERIVEQESLEMFRDFAHSRAPSGGEGQTP